MNFSADLESQSFVLIRVGERRFALSASEIAELVAPARVHRFPHRTPRLEGVFVRRGRVVPVCDIARELIGSRTPSRRFYLIAQRRFGSACEWIALPVSGECALIAAEMTSATGENPPHVAGWISHEGAVIEVLNLGRLTPGPDTAAKSSLARSGQEVRP